MIIDRALQTTYSTNVVFMHDKCHHHYKSENIEKSYVLEYEKNLKINGERHQGEAD